VTSGALPPDLQPALGDARKDLPRSYADGCHLDFPTVDPPDCAYGDTASGTTVVLVGDSHAAQWLPTLEVLAVERGWRLVSLTKSACPMVDVPVWNASLKREYRECDAWREHVFERLAQESPLITFVASADMYELADEAGRRPAGDTPEWADGLTRMLETARRDSGRVVLMADTPRVGYDPLECLATQADIAGCAVPAALMVDRAYAAIEAESAAAAGADLVPVAEWVCPGASCPLVRGSTLVYRDSHHLTATFAARLAGELAAQLGLDEAIAPTPVPSLRAGASPSVTP
jgi:hypothetical protein